MVASVPILATKLYIPPTPPKVVVHARLIERLNERVRVSGCNKPEGMMMESQVDKEIASPFGADIWGIGFLNRAKSDLLKSGIIMLWHVICLQT